MVTEDWEDSHCIFMLQLVVCNIGSDYNDSLYVVIPEKNKNKKKQHVIWTTKRNSKAKTWVSHVKRLFCVNGFGYVWMYGEVGDERRFLHVFKERLKGCFNQ